MKDDKDLSLLPFFSLLFASASERPTHMHTHTHARADNDALLHAYSFTVLSLLELV